MTDSTQKIIAMSGRKQSGKNTSCNFIAGMVLLETQIVRDKFLVDEDGRLWISDLFGDTEFEGWLDLNRQEPIFQDFAEKHIYPFVKIYSFADLLKQEICIKILGLTVEQCYGTDEDKNSLTHLRWENMPGVITEIPCEIPTVGFLHKKDEWEFVNGRIGEYYKKHGVTGIIYHPPGFMTARDVMQYVGTDVFRKMYGNVWVDGTLRRIREEGAAIALVCDCRFPNEVDGVIGIGGHVVRFTRDPFKDMHSSEVALDRNNYDWKKFSLVVDNAEMTINQQNAAVYDYLYGVGMAPEIKK